MPKDEFDFEDPLELNGMALLTEEDTTDAMCECFIEEFMRMGYDTSQVLALFRNPHYLGMNMVLEKRGEQFVRDSIAETFARWGRLVAWPTNCSSRRKEAHSSSVVTTTNEDQSLLTSAATIEPDTRLTDPMGAPVPKFNV
jgi:hypothetical protein